MQQTTLNISTSPHLTKGVSTDTIMLHVVYAMLPVVGFAIYSFGLNALLIVITSVSACVLSEHVLCRVTGKNTTVNDWSAVITGILLALTLPPIFPLWMTFFGGFIAIAVGKFAFGGLGYNVFNPALVGRAVLQAAFPVAITTWYPAMEVSRFSSVNQSLLAFPLMKPEVDAFSGATPLSAFKFEGVDTAGDQLFLGFVSGSLGETSALLILIGGLYLVIRNFMNWRIPVAIVITVFTFSWLMNMIDSSKYPDPVFMLFAGGLMLGAVFMATDMVASPLTPLGVIIYGIIIGLLIIVIRLWGGLPEGVMYAILIGNAASPHIDNLIKNRVYGTGK